MNNYYIYESCGPLNSFSVKNSQIIQTQPISGVSLGNEIFKDEKGICWIFLGSFDESYVAPFNVFPVYFSGNYFSNIVNIKYPSCSECQSTVVSSCTETYFSAVRCDNSNSVNVKVCNVGPTVGNLKLQPTVGQTVGVKNLSGDDFCVTLLSQINAQNTDYEVITPAWENYNCDSCPLLKKYTADACDGSVSGVTVYTLSSTTTITVGYGVRINNDDMCYEIKSFDGLVVEYNTAQANSNFVTSVYSNCENCLITLYRR